MGWRVGSRTWLDFTLAERAQVEASAGCDWWELDPCRVLAHAVAVLELDRPTFEVLRLTVGDVGELFADCDDDLPTEYDNRLPVESPRLEHDRWVVWGASRGWPPDVTERQTMRNLRLLADADE